MTKKFKATTILLAVALCIVTGSYVSKATTIDFNVTVNQNTMNKDPLSRKAIKDDGERNFYVTPTSFSCSGSIKVRSVRNIDISQCSSWAYVYSDNINITTVNPYNRSVYPGELYYMQTYYGAGSSSEMNVRGRYTP